MFSSKFTNFFFFYSRAIKTNPDVVWSNPFANLFRNDFWGTPINTNSSHKSYRPLCVLTFKLNHLVHQFDPFGYHLVNLVIHCLVCLVYMSLIKKWTYNQKALSIHSLSAFKSWKQFSAIQLTKKLNQLPIYLLASVLFCVHPIHTEAVAGLVGRADLGCALFFLLSLHFYDDYLKSIYIPSENLYNFKRERTQSIKMNNKTKCFDLSSLIRLYLAIISGTISILFKEYGLMIFAVCAFYHLITHCSHLRTSADCIKKRGRLINLNTAYLNATYNQNSNNILKRRFSFAKLTTTNRLNGKEDKCDSFLKGKVSRTERTGSGLFAFFKCLYAMLNNKLFNELRTGLIHLFVALIITLALRIWVMGELKAPQFSPADNPIAVHKSASIRTLTFLYLIAFNFGLLLYPATLSFDWSMNSIPPVKPNDLRNFATFIFFTCLIYFVVKLINYYVHLISSCLEVLDDDLVVNEEPNLDHYNSDFESYESSLLDEQSDSHESYCCSNCPTDSNFEPDQQTNSKQLNFKLIDICSLSIVLLVLPFLPATNLVAYVGFVVAERCLYVPSMGFCLIIGLAVFQFRQQLVKSPFILSAVRKLKVSSVKTSSLSLIRKHRFFRNGNQNLNDTFHNQLNDQKNKNSFNKFLSTSDLDEYASLLLNLVIFILLICLTWRTYLRNLDWSSEEALYRSGINVNPPKALGNLASILSSNGFKQEAEATYRRALKYRGNMADVHYNLGILLQEQRRYDEALESYANSVKFRPRLAAAYLNMGVIFSLIKKKDLAIEMYKHCASIDGDGLKDQRTHEQSRISALFNLGKLYADQGDYNQAINTYKQAISRDESRTYYQLHSLYNLIGEAYFKLGEYNQAEQAYLKAFELKPDHLPLYLTYAKFLSNDKIKRYEDAEKWFLSARLLAPNDTSVLLHYGQFLCDLKKFDKAADIYQSSIENMPASFELLFNFANALRLSKRFQEAEHYYRLAVALRPENISAILNLGAILHLNGKHKEAEKYYLDSLKLRPNDVIAKGNLVKLRKLMRNQKLKIKN